MTPLIKTLSIAVLISSFFSPEVLAKKSKKLPFEKQKISAQQDITGKLLYLNERNNNADLLIQNNDNFVYYPQIVSGNIEENMQVFEIPKNVQFYNKGTLANTEKDVIFYLSGSQVSAYDIATKQTKKLIDVKSLFHYQQEFSAKFNDFVLDLNGDGLSDVITYSLDKTHLYIQTATGEFSHQALNLAPKVSSRSDGVSFTPRPFYFIDINGDDKKDVTFQVDDKLVAFAQTNDGGFSSNAQEISLNAGLLSRIAYKKLQKSSNKKLANVNVESIEDLNNDGIVDLITKEKTKSGMMSFDNDLKIRFGYLANGLLAFKQKPDGKAVFKGEGEMVFKDINNDGFKDYYTTSAEIGLGMIMSAMSGSVDLDMRFYLMQDDGQYNKKPAFESEMEVAISDDSAGLGLNAIEDFNGDGLNDLVIQTDDDEFKVFIGGTKRIFAKRGVKYSIDMPIKGRTEVKDFNGDGKADMLFLHGKKYDEDEEKEVGQNQMILWLSAS